MARRARLSECLLRAQPLYRQLRPGQHQRGQRCQPLHRLVQPGRRLWPTALGQQGRRVAWRPPASGQGVRLSRPAVAGASGHVRHLPVGAALGSLGFAGLRPASLFLVHHPLCGTSRQPPQFESLATGPELCAALQAANRAGGETTRRSVQSVRPGQTGYNVNPYARDATFGQARDHFDARRVQVSVGLDI